MLTVNKPYCRARVSTIMEPKIMEPDARQITRFQQRQKTSLQEVARIDRRTSLRRKDEIAAPVGVAVGCENFGNARRDVYAPPASVLWPLFDSTHGGFGHGTPNL